MKKLLLKTLNSVSCFGEDGENRLDEIAFWVNKVEKTISKLMYLLNICKKSFKLNMNIIFDSLYQGSIKYDL